MDDKTSSQPAGAVEEHWTACVLFGEGYSFLGVDSSVITATTRTICLARRTICHRSSGVVRLKTKNPTTNHCIDSKCSFLH